MKHLKGQALGFTRRTTVLPVLLGALTALLLLVGCSYHPKPKVTDLYDPPHFVSSIKLPEDGKPAWVYAGNNNIYVSYFGREFIDIFTPEGKQTKSFSAALKGGFGSPQGIAISGNRLLVADYKNKALIFFSLTGDYIESFGKLPNNDEFIPVGVAVYNRVFYITDKKVHGWMAIGDDGELINVVQGKGTRDSLQFPYGIAVTEDGRIIVTDPQDGKIKAFACVGRYAYDFPTTEVGLLNPQGVAVDGLGRIHVVDNGTNRVFVFDNLGHYLFKYGKDLLGPSNIAVDKERQRIYITNTEKGNLSVWSY